MYVSTHSGAISASLTLTQDAVFLAGADPAAAATSSVALAANVPTDVTVASSNYFCIRVGA